MADLTGPRERAKRANRQIVALERSFQGFFKTHVYEVGIAEFDTQTDNYSLRVKSGPEIFPIDWSLCIGEIAHNLRAALDGITWQLATITPVYEHTAFPIFIKRLSRTLKDGSIVYAFDNPGPAAKRGAAAAALRSVPSSFWATIEAFQPYKRGNGGLRSPLYLLNELNNSDKHRLVAVLAAVPSTMELSGLTGGSHFQFGVTLGMNAKVGWVKDVPPNITGQGGVYLLDVAGMANWKPGDKIKVTEPEMYVNARIGPSIRFGDTCKAVERLPVIRTLHSMADVVSRVIESFV